jgi:vacuolar protein sorting-associated protein 33A
VIERSLAGPIGVVVKVSTLQEYGVDKFFFLENNNADTSQQNVVFMARGECARHAQNIAGELSHHLNYGHGQGMRQILAASGRTK